MSNTTILQVSARLEADKQWSTFFEILRDYGDALSAVWLKEDKERSLSFAEMTRRADDYAAYLAANTPEGGWIAIAVDTCPNWPTLFWGVIRSGHNALLLDASAADSMIQGLLEEAGCKIIISRKPRGLSGDIRQIDYKTVALSRFTGKTAASSAMTTAAAVRWLSCPSTMCWVSWRMWYWFPSAAPSMCICRTGLPTPL